MKAKCPVCFGENPKCKKCGGTGFLEASFAAGKIYTRHCTDPACGFDNGGKIVGPGACREESLNTPPGPCVHCESPTEWLQIGIS